MVKMLCKPGPERRLSGGARATVTCVAESVGERVDAAAVRRPLSGRRRDVLSAITHRRRSRCAAAAAVRLLIVSGARNRPIPAAAVSNLVSAASLRVARARRAVSQRHELISTAFRRRRQRRRSLDPTDCLKVRSHRARYVALRCRASC